MTYQTIRKMQSIYLPVLLGDDTVQDMIDKGFIWKLEGSMGRYAMDLLRGGVCMLPLERRIDYYGNTVPSRNDVKPGTPGSFQNCQGFWARVDEGDIDAIEALDYI